MPRHNFIIKLLEKGDKRTVRGVSQAVALVAKDPALLENLFIAMTDDNEAFNMRLLDVIEKVTRDHHEWLKPYKEFMLQELMRSTQKEVRWHLAQMIPRLTLNKIQRQQVVAR